jgi:phenylpropionate dioxygenase-like ring-hydroxylating dioxygenase large terminal subunit
MPLFLSNGIKGKYMTTTAHSDVSGKVVSENLRDALDQGYTLPATWYTDPAFFAREKALIFRRNWQYVGLTEQVTQPGDFFTCTIGNVPIVVTRDESGELRAFVNVCRHRGSELVLQPCGNRKTLQCHYHAWTYNLDGTLRSAPGMKDEPGFDKTLFPLHNAQIETWGPFIFVNPDKNAAPLKDILGELPQLLAATGLRLNEVKRRVRQTYEIAANWKTVVDNYLECYHCPIAHPGFSSVIDVNNYTVTEYEYFSTQGGPKKEVGKNGKPELYNTTGDVKDGFYAYLWPNFTLNVYPGPGHLSLNLFLPIDVNKTLAIFEYCFVDEVSAEEEQNFAQFIDQVQQEDTVLCESVQRGLASGFYNQGRLMLHRENGLRHFQKLIHRALAE